MTGRRRSPLSREPNRDAPSLRHPCGLQGHYTELLRVLRQRAAREVDPMISVFFLPRDGGDSSDEREIRMSEIQGVGYDQAFQVGRGCGDHDNCSIGSPLSERSEGRIT